jgi:hypothetical protein
MNNVSIPLAAYNSGVYPYEGTTVAKIINQYSNPSIQVMGLTNDGTNNTGYAAYRLAGGIQFGAINNSIGAGKTFYVTYPASARMQWSGGDPATASNAGMDWSFASGWRTRFWENDGATPLMDVNASSGANQINLCSPGATANNTFSVGCSGFRFGFSGPNYFTFSGTPTAARTITAPDGASSLSMVASLTTTSATSDNVTIQGMTSSGHCGLSATNSTAATNIATTYVSAKTTNQITVTHTATSGMTYDIHCTSN